MSHKSINIYKIHNQVPEQCDNILACDNFKIMKTLKNMNTISYKIYIYKNLYLYVDVNGNKTCIKYETKETKITDNKYLQEYQEYSIIPLELFPFIDHYDKIIECQTITTYYDITNKLKFNIVMDDHISYINITDDIVDINNILKFIK